MPTFASVDPNVIWPAIGVIVSGVVGLYVAVMNRRQGALRLEGDHFSRTIEGFEALLDEQEKRIANLEASIVRLRSKVVAAQEDADRANRHALDCERELRSAKNRIAQLEAS